MATNPRFEDDRFGPDIPERPQRARSSCLRGCLIVFVVLAILAIIAGVVVWQNWRNWAAALGEQAIGEMIAQAEFPVAERQEIKQQVQRVSEAFRSGKLSAEQLAKLIEKIGRSPLMVSIIGSAVNVNYIARSGLNDDEKVAARQTVRRFLRGVVDQKIDESAVDAAMAHVAVREADGSWKLKERLSDEELRQFLAVAKAAADKAEVPVEAEDFDPSDELKRIVDEALR